jgi:hypothetical protein
MKFELILGMKMINNSMMVEENGLKNLDLFPCECCLHTNKYITQGKHHFVIRCSAYLN